MPLRLVSNIVLPANDNSPSSCQAFACPFDNHVCTNSECLDGASCLRYWDKDCEAFDVFEHDDGFDNIRRLGEGEI